MSCRVVLIYCRCNIENIWTYKYSTNTSICIGFIAVPCQEQISKASNLRGLSQLNPRHENCFLMVKTHTKWGSLFGIRRGWKNRHIRHLTNELYSLEFFTKCRLIKIWTKYRHTPCYRMHFNVLTFLKKRENEQKEKRQIYHDYA